jgi:hypothetical protein
MVLFAFSGLHEVLGQWTTSGNDIYNSNTGNVGIGNNAPSTLLYVAKSMTEPTITIRNLGGTGGATYSMIDNASGADWKFKATNTGGFKIRDHAFGMDVFVIEANSAANSLYINSAGNVGIGTSTPSELLHISGGNVKIGNISGDARKLYFGDGTGVYIGEEASDNRLGISSASLTVKIGGLTGIDGQVLTSDGVTCQWEDLPAASLSGTGTTDYIARWLSANTLGTGLIRDNNLTVGINVSPDPDYRLKVQGSNKTAVYGMYDINHYGYLGGQSYGAYGQYNSNIWGALGTVDYGVRGTHSSNGGAAGYFFHSGEPGSYTQQWSIDAYIVNSTANDGTSYAYGANSSGGLRAFSYNGATYTFGVGGWNYNDETRCGGVLGSDVFGNYWGALGYRAVGPTPYGGYFTSFYSETPKSSSELTGEGIGIGAWGGLMGADVHGGVYGIYVEGEHAALYANGPVFTNFPVIQLHETTGQERAVLYSCSSNDVTVMISGQGNLVNGHCYIKFDDRFTKVVSNRNPLVITVTPMGPTNGVYIASSDHNGFTVSENNNGRSTTSLSYIVVGKRAGYENPELAEEVISTEFEKMMSRGLHNDSDLSTQGEGLYYQDGRLMTGQAPGSQNRNIK